jgi:hypothetical protein
MSKGFKRIIFGFIGSQLAILAISLIFHQELSLLTYINISFYVASMMIFTSLLVYTVNSGFFDAMSYSFRTVFSGEKKKTMDEMTPLSQMVGIDTNPFLVVGVLNFFLMLAGLFFYYFN